MFRNHFHVSLRAKQIELRLLKARQLQATTDDKIIHIAIDSGFRNLGLFNALFKRQVGITPSEYREREARTEARATRGALAALVTVFFLSWMTLNAALPAPALTNALPASPTSTTNAGPAQAAARGTNEVKTFEVRGYNVMGNTLLPVSIIEPILRKHVNPAGTFDTTIRPAVMELQLAYRERGFVTVKVSVPRQDLTNGIVRLQVTEGRLVEINVVQNRHFSSNNVLRALPSLRTNIYLNALVFNQELERANASRDRQIYSLLEEGPEPGTSAITLRVKDRLPLHTRLDFNNSSTPGTPEMRLNFSAQYNNLWQLEHQFGVQYGFSPAEWKSYQGVPASRGAPFIGPLGLTNQGIITPGRGGRDILFYDQPQVANYSAYYRMPLGGVNGPGRSDGYALSEFGYDEVNHRFRAPLGADTREVLVYASRSASDTGNVVQSHTADPATIPSGGGVQSITDIYAQTLTINENAGLRLMQPLSKLTGFRSSLAAGVDFKKYGAATVQNSSSHGVFYVIHHTNANGVVIYDSHPSFTNTAYQLTERVLDYLPFQITWDGAIPDHLGSTMVNISHAFHFAGLISDTQTFHDLAGTNANGNYYILTAGVTRDQNVVGGWGVYLHADGQYANQPLISNEQFGMGGASGVRGYRDGQEYGDTGWRATVEPHTPLADLGQVDGEFPMYARLSVFVDYGQRFLLDPGTRQGHLNLCGAGAAVSGSIGPHIDYRITFGIPILEVPGRQAGEWRVLMGIGIQF